VIAPSWRFTVYTKAVRNAEFLATAEMADTDFTAEKMSNVQVVHKDQFNPYLLTPDQERKMKRKQAHHSQQLTVPRRPKWNADTTPLELDQMERESFLNWRRGLADLQENFDMLMTPFERNLEVWRQLWRVIERSDLVVQIVDARNPLLFRSVDLEKYVKEVDQKKQNLLLVNKADMMTVNQRKQWADYFEKEGVSYRFFSAALARQTLEEYESEDDEDEDEEEGGEEGDEAAAEALAEETSNLKLEGREEADEASDEEDPRIRIITLDELEAIFLENLPEPVQEDSDASTKPRKTTIGLVGYPNVGKSSTINALMGAKKVSVSATPGKTKHFQTLHLSEKIILCDCPGLVFPNFATTKAELVCNGILPIDQQREFTGPATLVAQRIPQWFIEAIYGIKIRTRPIEEGGTGIPTGTELLVAYAKARGFMKSSAGNPDDSRAARYILKDYINGKLLFCHPPPAEPPIDPLEFNAELYEDEDRLPERRRRKNVLAPSEAADSVGNDDDMISFMPARSGKAANLDNAYFGRGVGAGGHLTNPFHKQKDGIMQPASNTSAGRILSGRKAKTLIALENNLSPDEVAALRGTKKHFKANRRKKTRNTTQKMVDDGEVLS
jgi:large subunit GTPase 1